MNTTFKSSFIFILYNYNLSNFVLIKFLLDIKLWFKIICLIRAKLKIKWKKINLSYNETNEFKFYYFKHSGSLNYRFSIKICKHFYFIRNENQHKILISVSMPIYRNILLPFLICQIKYYNLLSGYESVIYMLVSFFFYFRRIISFRL